MAMRDEDVEICLSCHVGLLLVRCRECGAWTLPAQLKLVAPISRIAFICAFSPWQAYQKTSRQTGGCQLVNEPMLVLTRHPAFWDPSRRHPVLTTTQLGVQARPRFHLTCHRPFRPMALFDGIASLKQKKSKHDAVPKECREKAHHGVLHKPFQIIRGRATGWIRALQRRFARKEQSVRSARGGNLQDN